MLKVGENTYEDLDKSSKLNRTQFMSNKVSNDLYATLMLAKNEDSGENIKDMLSNDRETLSEQDKEKILYTLDYLRLRGFDKSIFDNITEGDLKTITSFKTASKRTENLIQVIIEKACDSRSFSDDDKNEFKNDLKQHVDATIRGRNAEVGNEIAEEISLTKYTTNRARYYGKRIQNVINENKDSSGVNWEKCYMDVIKYANYATLPVWKRTATRYIAPMKFGWRNTNKQVGNTIKALEKKVNESTDKKEMLAISSIIKNLKLAYDYYKEKTRVDNTSIDGVGSKVRERLAA